MYKKIISMALSLIMILSLLTPLTSLNVFAESDEEIVIADNGQLAADEDEENSGDITPHDEPIIDTEPETVLPVEPIEPVQDDEAPTIGFEATAQDVTPSDSADKITELADTGADSDMAQTGINLRSQALEWLRDKADNHIALDYDNSPPNQPYQCVDLAAKYLYFLGADGVVGGDAKDYCNKTGCLPSGWESIGNYAGFEPQPGDICVWGAYVTPANSDAGHIGVVYAVNGDTITTVEQNDEGRHYCEWCTRPKAGVTTYIRPAFDLEPPHIGRSVEISVSGSTGTGSSGGGHSSGSDRLIIKYSGVSDNVGVTEVYAKVREFGQTWDQAKTYSGTLNGDTATVKARLNNAVYI